MQKYAFQLSLLVFLIFGLTNTGNATSDISCQNRVYKISIKSSCPLPHGMDSVMNTPARRTNTSTIIYEKNGSVLLKKKMNCVGVISDGIAFYFTWFMDGESHDESTLVLTAMTYDSDVLFRAFNQIAVEKLESHSSLPITGVDKIQLRQTINSSFPDPESNAICQGFED